MSVKLPVISGERLIKILVKKVFSVRRQAGSHVVLQRGFVLFSVRLHEELKKGTLKAILNQSGFSVEDLLN
jgi:predicted RNA binding protein YcfA (HicA-like mRNA interferase family)